MQLLQRFIANSDIVTKHNLTLPEDISVPREQNGKRYGNHLYADSETGLAQIQLNNWEEALITEESQRTGFVCWLRNQSRASWALCMPYEMDRRPRFRYDRPCKTA